MASQVLETEFPRGKWRKSFYFFDVNKDGKVTREDLLQVADNISTLTNASEEEAKATRQEWLKWFPNRIDVFDIDKHMAYVSEYFRDVEEFKRQCRDTAADAFSRIDLNKNGVISLDEFELFYKVCGYNDRQLAHTNFSMIGKDNDGNIQREEFTDDYVRHFTDPDPVSGQVYIFAATGTH